MAVLNGELDASLETIPFEELTLMEGIPLEKRRAVLRCLHARVSRFEAGESLMQRVGTHLPLRYLVKGAVVYERVDMQGNRSLLDTAYEGSLIAAEAEGNLPLEAALIDIVALAPCTTLDFVLTEEVFSCDCCIKHVNTIRGNMVQALSAQTATLITKLALLSCRSTREKMIYYLQAHAKAANSAEFDISWSRQELADYLYVDRSALSRELSKMEKEGLMRFERNHFTLCANFLEL